jgi:hypothetical protein
MDINGARALRDRLGSNKADEASTTAADADIHADAPPVYHWLGVPQSEPSRSASDGAPLAQGTSLSRRLGLSFR